ncbi:hypothetical protein [Gracilibacillus sp. JCM 18860]|uniref:hypothetical protein n=1 Tax=Gracilibacillus sp. JCM 18860 TaxID=1306159 RepID=UPI0006D08023
MTNYNSDIQPNIKNKVLNIPVIVFILTVLLKVIMFILNGSDIFFIRQKELDIFLTILMLIMAIISMKYFFKDKVIKITFATLIGLILIYSLFRWLLLYSDINYISFSSPDGEIGFQVEETGHAKIFQTHGLFKVHKANIRTNNGYKTFTNDTYSLEWKEPNTLIISYKIYYADNVRDEISIKYDN